MIDDVLIHTLSLELQSHLSSVLYSRTPRVGIGIGEPRQIFGFGTVLNRTEMECDNFSRGPD